MRLERYMIKLLELMHLQNTSIKPLRLSYLSGLRRLCISNNDIHVAQKKNDIYVVSNKYIVG